MSKLQIKRIGHEVEEGELLAYFGNARYGRLLSFSLIQSKSSFNSAIAEYETRAAAEAAMIALNGKELSDSTKIQVQWLPIPEQLRPQAQPQSARPLSQSQQAPRQQLNNTSIVAAQLPSQQARRASSRSRSRSPPRKRYSTNPDDNNRPSQVGGITSYNSSSSGDVTGESGSGRYSSQARGFERELGVAGGGRYSSQGRATETDASYGGGKRQSSQVPPEGVDRSSRYSSQGRATETDTSYGGGSRQSSQAQAPEGEGRSGRYSSQERAFGGDYAYGVGGASRYSSQSHTSVADSSYGSGQYSSQIHVSERPADSSRGGYQLQQRQSGPLAAQVPTSFVAPPAAQVPQFVALPPGNQQVFFGRAQALRPGFGNNGRHVRLYANCFTLTRIPSRSFYQYDVVVSPDTIRKVKRRIFEVWARQAKVLAETDAERRMWTVNRLDIPAIGTEYEVALPDEDPNR
ncbi:hypothetical protein BC830DRAFT_1163483 [Chytriomyces sp. MP71]|nr:hypothetical protein BC830DRAFT_1163483 [Chytriomyces sp. MP71]